ncbi:hypothetical protein [Chitinivorax sp. B]|uniref:hypothetical protein n=1 Tax=Chitinivorax sp. B TaxID=2502235 RepID=UPI0010F4F701|nr:hypothetical protein [Chitinivorax sp. B]
MQVTFADMMHVKREAKKLGRDLSKRSHAQLLSLAAQNLFGVRNYHELKKRRQQALDQHLVHSGNVATCAYCGWLFCPDLVEDRKEHQARHENFELAAVALKYTPQHHVGREASKKRGYALMAVEEAESHVEGALLILRAWFDRSLDAAIDGGYWKNHPEFERYVSYLVGDLPAFPPDVVMALENRFGRVDGVIAKGISYWYPSKE